MTCHVSPLPRVHGSALFTRGETQSLATVTLGTTRDQQKTDGLFGEESQRFMLHYYFPSFSVGECRRFEDQDVAKSDTAASLNAAWLL